MSRIRSKHTEPERIVRSVLHRMGYRFRLHYRDLQGSPDIVLPKHKTAIFVNGCFWHRHEGCKYAYKPKSRIKFWDSKFKENVARDLNNYNSIKDMGWNYFIVWECETKNARELMVKLSTLLA